MNIVLNEGVVPINVRKTTKYSTIHNQPLQKLYAKYEKYIMMHIFPCRQIEINSIVKFNTFIP